MNPKKPLALERMEGNPGKRKLPEAADEISPPPEIPDCPKWLDAGARAEWKRVIPLLSTLGLLGKIDRAAVAGYCQAWARWEKAERILSKHGLTKTLKNGYIMPRPEVAIAHKYLGMVKAFCSEFGMTPSARGRMSIAKMKEKDEMDELIDGRQGESRTGS